MRSARRLGEYRIPVIGFFGSFVSVFYNPKIADADRVLRLRSQPFFRPPP